MRDWLTVIIVLLIAGVVLDGLRRMRKARREAIKMSLSMHTGADKDDVDSFGSELPNGGARVVGVRDEEDARALTQSMQEKHRLSKTTCGVSKPVAVQPSVEEEYGNDDGRLEPTITSEALDDDSLVDYDDSYDDIDDSDVRQLLNDSEPEDELEPENESAPPELDPLFMDTKPLEPIKPATQGELFAPEEPADEEEEEAEEVLVINVMGGQSGMISGEALLEVCMAEGLKFGEREIFHRYEKKSGKGDLLFSMVNMVKPGTFDLSDMKDFQTPGVSLFMALPMKANSVEAFNTMAMTAAVLAETLGCELKDETRSAMTNQTLEHCRQRIIEFERKRQLMSAH